MRIGIDATCWANPRGYGRFTRELMAAMVVQAPADQFICFLDDRAQECFSLEGPNVMRVVVRQSVSPTLAAGAHSSRSVRDMLRLTRAVGQAGLDVFFSPSVYTYFPLPLGLPAVITFHDAIADRFPRLTLPSLRARVFWRAKVMLALRQARLVLTVSEYAAGELSAFLNIPPARLRVAVEAPAPVYRPSEDPAQIREAQEEAGLPPGARWLIYLGGFNPHKHVERLVEAHAALVAQLDNPPFLVLVGAIEGDVFHGSLASVRDAVSKAGTEHLVRWTGFLADEQVRHLLSGAVALVLPSASEGFGLPAIEAAACGTPVVATTASPLPRLLEGGGVFIPPGDAPALTLALTQLLTDEPARRRLGAEARRRAALLSWEAAARSALAALREAAA